MKIRKKLIGTYIIVVLIPIFLVGFILTNGMINMAIDQAIKEASTNTDRIQIRLNEMLGKITEVSDRLYFNSQSVNILSGDYRKRWDIVKAYMGFVEFNEYKRAYSEIHTIRIYADNKALLNNWEFIPVEPGITGTEWYNAAVDKNGEILWQYAWNELYRRYGLCLTRLVKGDFNRKLGVMVIELNNAYVQGILAEEPFKTFIALDNNTIIYSNDPSLAGEKVPFGDIGYVPDNAHNNVRDMVFRGEASKIIANSFTPKSSNNVFNVCTIVPINAITKKANEISKLGFGIMGVSFIISFMLLTFFSSVLSKRIIRLRSEMHKVVLGNYEIDSEIAGMDEIGELHEDLLRMVKSFKQLIHEVYEERLLKEQLSVKQKEIEYRMLANQINPHFLYNMLETIRMRAHSKGDDEISGVVKLLARLMRKNLEAASKTVTLESEIETVKNYLELQKFRYEDKIDYVVEVLVNSEDYRILPLLLQPIVENAFIHGLECKRTHGSIRIRAENSENFLIISVEDNGMGMSAEKLEHMRRMLKENNSGEKTHVGLQNVNSRIKLYYGEKYGLEIESEENAGTKVILKLPPWEVGSCA